MHEFVFSATVATGKLCCDDNTSTFSHLFILVWINSTISCKSYDTIYIVTRRFLLAIGTSCFVLFYYQRLRVSNVCDNYVDLALFFIF